VAHAGGGGRGRLAARWRARAPGRLAGRVRDRRCRWRPRRGAAGRRPIGPRVRERAPRCDELVVRFWSVDGSHGRRRRLDAPAWREIESNYPGDVRRAAGIERVVCAPGLIPRGATDHVRTDRRGAEWLVRLPVAGERHRVGGFERRGQAAERGCWPCRQTGNHPRSGVAARPCPRSGGPAWAGPLCAR
jgi:hypothetical protein